jgi:hypothetical protein
VPATEGFVIAGTREDGKVGNFGLPGNSGQCAASAPEDEGDDEEDDADHEQDLGEVGRKAGDAAEAEKRRDERDDGKDDSPSEHDKSPVWTQSATRPTALAGDVESCANSSVVDVRVTLARFESSAPQEHPLPRITCVNPKIFSGTLAVIGASFEVEMAPLNRREGVSKARYRQDRGTDGRGNSAPSGPGRSSRAARLRGPLTQEIMMADDKRLTGAPDRDRISLSEDYEIRDWTQSLGVGEDELREAVDAVGNSADAVRAYLNNGR